LEELLLGESALESGAALDWIGLDWDWEAVLKMVLLWGEFSVCVEGVQQFGNCGSCVKSGKLPSTKLAIISHTLID